MPVTLGDGVGGDKQILNICCSANLVDWWALGSERDTVSTEKMKIVGGSQY